MKSQQIVVIASFQNCDNDYGCIQIKLNLRDYDASHCEELKRISHFLSITGAVSVLLEVLDVRHKRIIIALIKFQSEIKKRFLHFALERSSHWISGQISPQCLVNRKADGSSFFIFFCTHDIKKMHKISTWQNMKPNIIIKMSVLH